MQTGMRPTSQHHLPAVLFNVLSKLSHSAPCLQLSTTFHNDLLLQHDGFHLPDFPSVTIRTPHLVRRSRRNRQRLRFSHYLEIQRYTRRFGPCSEHQAFRGSLLEIVPTSTSVLARKTMSRTRAQRHRHRWHKRHRSRLFLPRIQPMLKINFSEEPYPNPNVVQMIHFGNTM